MTCPRATAALGDDSGMNSQASKGLKIARHPGAERSNHEERSNMLMLLKVHPSSDSLRGDPRFAKYLLRANLSS